MCGIKPRRCGHGKLAGMSHEFKLPDMVCGACAQSVTQAVRTLDPQAQVQVDLPSQTVKVESTQARAALAQALAGAGFTERLSEASPPAA